MVTKASLLTMLALAFALFACGDVPVDSKTPTSASTSQDKPAEDFETRQTEKLLGVALQTFPDPQGLTKFDESPANRPALKFTVKEQPLTGAPPAWDQSHSIVQANGPDGSVYEAYSGRAVSEEITDSRSASTAANTRQMYGTHHGYGYTPQDVYIGKRVGKRIKPSLFFPDVGSHTTAPYHFAIDNKGMVHLIVADVNIYQENRLDMYWVIGDPNTGKWSQAWLVERRGLTSSSRPWSGAWADKVNLIWTWDKMGSGGSPDNGIFHVQWQQSGFGKKVRVIDSVPTMWAAAVDPQSGRLLFVYSDDKGVYLTSRPEGGAWTMPARLDKSLQKAHYVSATSSNDGEFIIRTTAMESREWLVRLL